MDETNQDPAQDPEQTPSPETTEPAQNSPPQAPPGPASEQTGAIAGEFDTSDFVNSFIQTVKDVVARPQEFFAAMPRNGGYGNVILFGIVAAAIGAVFGNVVGINPGAAIAGVFVGPLSFLVGSFVAGGIIHVTSLIFADGAKGGFEATWRAVAYPSGALALVTFIPVIGFFASLYGIYLTIVGIQNVHNTTIGKAVLAVLIPVAVFLVLAIVISIFVGLAIFGAAVATQ